MSAKYLVPHIIISSVIHHALGCECLLYTLLEKEELIQITLAFKDTFQHKEQKNTAQYVCGSGHTPTHIYIIMSPAS